MRQDRKRKKTRMSPYFKGSALSNYLSIGSERIRVSEALTRTLNRNSNTCAYAQQPLTSAGVSPKTMSPGCPCPLALLPPNLAFDGLLFLLPSFLPCPVPACLNPVSVYCPGSRSLPCWTGEHARCPPFTLLKRYWKCKGGEHSRMEGDECL